MSALRVQPRATRAPFSDPGLERLHFALEGARHRIRLEFLDLDLDDDRDRILEWLEEGGRVDDQAGYREWLLERRARFRRRVRDEDADV